MPFFERPSQYRDGLCRDVPVNHEKRGFHLMLPEDIEQLRRGCGIRAVVERQINRWRICRGHSPHRPFRDIEQKRKWSEMRQDRGGDDANQPEHRGNILRGPSPFQICRLLYLDKTMTTEMNPAVAFEEEDAEV